MRWMLAMSCGLVWACGGTPRDTGTPKPITGGAAEVDSLWAQANRSFRAGQWDKTATTLERLVFEFPPGDPRIARTHFLMGESYFAIGDQLRAAREFRVVSERTPNDSLAPEALLRVGDVFGDLWRKPELDPSYGQSALATYQELLSRYPNSSVTPRAQERIARLQEEFADKDLKNGMFYFRLKAYDSAIIYFTDLLRNYGRTRVAPDALIKLIETYRALGYAEERTEKCGFARQNYPGVPGLDRLCPPVGSTP